jgi:hypothetical protein
MAQTAAQKAAALKKAAAAALKRAQAIDNSAEIAATASRRAVIETAPTPEPAPVVSNTPRLDAVKAATVVKRAADVSLKESTKPADLDNPPAGTYYQWHVFAGGGGEWRLIKTGSFGGAGEPQGPSADYGWSAWGDPYSSDWWAYYLDKLGLKRGGRINKDTGGAVKNAMDVARAYKKGGPVWDKPRPKSLGKPTPLSSDQKSSAKAMAKAAGRPYPNLVDNLRAAKKD